MAVLYHANSATPDSEDPLLVRAISENIAMDGTDGKEVGGLLFASGTEEARQMGLAYAMKSDQQMDDEGNPIGSEHGTMSSAFNVDGIAIAVLTDRESMLESPPTGYLYELPDESFEQVIHKETGEPTTEYISTEDVVADKVTKIEGPEIPMENGVQVFFINDTTVEEYREQLHNTFNEAEKDAPSDPTEQKAYYKQATLDLLNEMTENGTLIHENEAHNVPTLNLSTGELELPTSLDIIKDEIAEALGEESTQAFAQQVSFAEKSPAAPLGSDASTTSHINR